MRNKCLICSQKLTYNSSFTLKCKNCRFYVSNLKSGFGAPIEGLKRLRLLNFKKIFASLNNEIKKNSKILEMGPGKGLFMELARAKGLDVTGIEPGLEESRELSKKGFKIFNKEFPLKKKKLSWQYDFIIFNDVFEHIDVSKLNDAIRQCYMLLKKDAYLVINLPTTDGFFFNLSIFFKFFKINFFYERLWQKKFSSPHMIYFNSKNLNRFIQKHNFRLYREYSLAAIDQDSKKRILSSNKKSKILKFIALNINYLYIFIKLFPSDAMLKIYKKK